MKLISIFQTLKSIGRVFSVVEFVFINECVKSVQNEAKEKEKNGTKYRHTGYDTSSIESHVINVCLDCC